MSSHNHISTKTSGTYLFNSILLLVGFLNMNSRVILVVKIIRNQPPTHLHPWTSRSRPRAPAMDKDGKCGEEGTRNHYLGKSAPKSSKKWGRSRISGKTDSAQAVRRPDLSRRKHGGDAVVKSGTADGHEYTTLTREWRHQENLGARLFWIVLLNIHRV